MEDRLSASRRDGIDDGRAAARRTVDRAGARIAFGTGATGPARARATGWGSRRSRPGRRRHAASAALALAVVPLALAALLIALPAARARAEEAPVTVGPAEVSSALFVAGDVSRLSEVPAGTESLVLEKALQQIYADEPELAPATAESYVHDMEDALAAPSSPSPASLQLMAGNQRILAIIAALERPSGSHEAELPATAKLAVTHLAASALSGSSDIFASADVPKYFEPLADARTNLTFTSFAPANVLRTTRELSGTNRLFGEARDALWGGVSEESVFAEWGQLLSESNVLRSEALKDLRTAVESGNGSLTDTPAQLTALFSTGQTKTQEQSCEHAGSGEEAIGGESIPGVPRLKCSGGALYEAVHAPRKCTEKAVCEAELTKLQSQAAGRNRAIAEERAEMVAAAELLRPSDNTAAALQDATAQAQAQITEEEAAWASYEAEKAEKEAILGGAKEGVAAGTSVAALAGGEIAGGISGLIDVGFEVYENVEGAMSNPPPGPQEITLQDLADLSEQLAGFQQYTQEAFHAINTQLAQLSSQLARENYELKQQLDQLGERLVREQSTIFALQNEVQTLFAAQTKANLQETIEDSVGWLKRTGEPLSGQRMQEALVALKKYATEIANGALVNNAETQPYSFEGAYRQLADVNTTGEPAHLSEDISYLARFPGEQGWPSPVAPSTLANTTFWSESSRAYAQLMLENAGHVTSADIAGLKELEAEALKLEKTEGAWSEDSAEGSQTGNAILNHAIADFERAAHGAGVDGTSSIQALLAEAAEGSFDESLEKLVKTGSPLANPTGVKLWAGAEQSFNAHEVSSAKYPALKWTECSGSAGANGTKEMPEGFIASLPPALVNGVRLGVIGASGSGDPLVLDACRDIQKKVETTKEEAVTAEAECEHDKVPSTCKVVYEYEIKSEREPETVSVTLTLREGESGPILAAPSVGSCSQSPLYWTGRDHVGSIDPTDSELDESYAKLWELKIGKNSFEGRHVGSAYGLKVEGSESGSKYSYEGNPAPFEGVPCPYEGTIEEAGVEYADYGEGTSNPLASAEPTLVEEIDAKLRQLQEEAYAEGLKALKSPPKGNPVESLGGAKALVQSLVKLGLPQAVDSDLTLQSDVEGIGAQFLDPEPGAPRPPSEQLNALVASWIHRLEHAGESGEPGVGQVVGEDLIEEVATRSEGWAKQVAEQVAPYVEGKAEGFDTGTEEAVGEQSALVESTLNRMQLTRDVLDEARAPTAETLTPREVGTSAATVRGEVDPNGGTVESCLFEYGATRSYGHTIECSSIPAGNERAVVVSAKIADWTHEGSFHERVVMKTWGGTSYGQDVKVQLAQSTKAPAGGLLIASTSTSGATVGTFTAEELPAGAALPAGARQIVGLLSFTVNVTPGGSARVKIELPSGSAPNALYKLMHTPSGATEYVEIPSSLYTISGATIELTLVDGGADDEDGQANGVIVDPLVPVVEQPASPTAPSKPSSPPTPAGPSTPGTTPTTHHGRHGHHARRECVNRHRAIVNLAAVTLPPGKRIVRSELLVGGHVVARLGGRAKAAVVRFAGHHSGAYEVTLVAKLSNGRTLRKKLFFRGCAPLVSPPHACVSHDRVTVHVGDLRLPPGTRVRRAIVRLQGHVVARLGGQAKGAVVSLGRHRRRYLVAVVARLSNGKTIRRRIVFHDCSARGRRR